MKKIRALAVVMLIAFSSFAQNFALLDSTILYDWTSGSAEMKLKNVYDGYTSENQVSHITKYFLDDTGLWVKFAEESITYNDNGDTLEIESFKTVQDTGKVFEADSKKVFLYDKGGNLVQKIYYYNKYDRLGITPNWEEQYKYMYYVNEEGAVDSVEKYVGLKYWQGTEKTYLVYNDDGNVEAENKSIWLPEIKVKKYNEAYYSQNTAGDANYLFAVYNVERQASADDLADIYVSKLAEVVNVFAMDGDTEKRYDITDNIAGKSLKEILENNNIQIADLRDDYYEWFKTVEDDRNTLLNCNIKVGRPFDVIDVVDEYTGLYREVGSVILNVNAYRIKGAADIDQLTGYSAPNDAVWANIYIGDGDDETVERVTGVAGKSLNTILTENNISIASLSQDHIEKYMDKTGDVKRRKINVEIITPQLNDTKVDVYSKLYDTVNSHMYSLTAYNVHSDAQTGDLDDIITASDITSVFVYKNDGSIVEITSNIQDKTLSTILADNGIQISDLSTDNKDWLYDEDGRRVRLAVNIKAGKDLGAVNDVVTTENLYSSGSNDYINTTYKINTTDWTALESITLGSDVDFLDVYIINGDGDKERIDLHGVAGKTLAAAMKASGNNEGIDINLSQLRDNYGEWFYNKDGKLVYNKFNAKAAVAVQNSPVKIKDNLITTSGSYAFMNKAYLIEPYADTTDLKSYTIDDEVEYLNVYLDGIRHSLHGVAGKTLKAVLIDGDNDEMITVSISDLNQKYVEWFVSMETGEADLVNLNLKAVYRINDDLQKNINSIGYTYSDGKLTKKLTTWYGDDGTTPDYYEQHEYTLNSDGYLSSDVYSDGDNLLSLSKQNKTEYTYNIIGSINEMTYYTFDGSDFKKAFVNAYYYIAFKAFAGKDQTVVDEDGNGEEDVILDGTSTYILAGNIQSYEWIAGDTVLATGDSVKVTLPVGNHTIVLKVTDDNDNVDTDTCIVVVEGAPMSVNDNSTNRINIYPNPVNDILNISMDYSDNISIQVINISGQVVRSVTDNTGNISINLSDLNAGIYFVKIVANDVITLNKIVKN